MGDDAGSGLLERKLTDLISGNAAELTSLNGNLLNAAKGRETRSLLITSAHPGEGKTTAAISFAATLANHNRSLVALLDANFYAPRLHDLFHIDSTPGLSDILTDGYAAKNALHQTNYDNLHVLPAGSALPRSIGQHEVVMLQKVINALLQDFSFVIVDGCHFLDYSDVALYASVFDGIVVVIECEKTKWEVVRQVKDSLDNIGGRVLGTVLSKRRYYIPRNLYGKI
jgi:capsular exopolysaccharide synthesis family protein